MPIYSKVSNEIISYVSTAWIFKFHNRCISAWSLQIGFLTAEWLQLFKYPSPDVISERITFHPYSWAYIWRGIRTQTCLTYFGLWDIDDVFTLTTVLNLRTVFFLIALHLTYLF